MTKILKELEQEGRFEECAIILKSMVSYKDKFKLVEDDIPTQWSEEFEKEYYNCFKKLDSSGELLARSNMDYYLKEIKERLKL